MASNQSGLFKQTLSELKELATIRATLVNANALMRDSDELIHTNLEILQLCAPKPVESFPIPDFLDLAELHYRLKQLNISTQPIETAFLLGRTTFESTVARTRRGEFDMDKLRALSKIRQIYARSRSDFDSEMLDNAFGRALQDVGNAAVRRLGVSQIFITIIQCPALMEATGTSGAALSPDFDWPKTSRVVEIYPGVKRIMR